MKKQLIWMTGPFDNLPIPEGVKSGDEVNLVMTFNNNGDNSYMSLDVVPAGKKELLKPCEMELELREIISATLKNELGWTGDAYATAVASAIVDRIRPHEEVVSLAQLGLASHKYIAAVDILSPVVQDSALGSPGDDVFKLAETVLKKKWQNNKA